MTSTAIDNMGLSTPRRVSTCLEDSPFTPRNPLEPFPSKLYGMLEELEQLGMTQAVCWLPHGRAFVIRDNKRFMSEIAPRYFKVTKIRSIHRQLNMYGFNRIPSGVDTGAWYHKDFLRGKPDDVHKISRKKGPKRCEASVPNFYDMPPLPFPKTTESESAQMMKSAAIMMRWNMQSVIGSRLVGFEGVSKDMLDVDVVLQRRRVSICSENIPSPPRPLSRRDLYRPMELKVDRPIEFGLPIPRSPRADSPRIVSDVVEQGFNVIPESPKAVARPQLAAAIVTPARVPSCVMTCIEVGKVPVPELDLGGTENFNFTAEGTISGDFELSQSVSNDEDKPEDVPSFDMKDDMEPLSTSEGSAASPVFSDDFSLFIAKVLKL